VLFRSPRESRLNTDEIERTECGHLLYKIIASRNQMGIMDRLLEEAMIRNVTAKLATAICRAPGSSGLTDQPQALGFRVVLHDARVV
jgi:hypothetical protein